MSIETGLICVMSCDKGYSHGTVTMTNLSRRPGVVFHVRLHNLPSGYHAFHVHNTGNISKKCETLGPHYNPTDALHGALNDPRSHYGDLGNILVQFDGTVDIKIESHLLSLEQIIGRSLVIHANKDDLGRGGNPESLISGNSGHRMLCGVIGYK